MRAVRPTLALSLGLSSAGGGVCAAADGSAPPAERRFAVLVSHTDGGPGTERLQYATRDARKLGDVLTQMGGFAPADTTYLVAPDAAALRGALARVEAELAVAKRSGAPTLLLFYYSGHAGDGSLRLGDTRLPLAELQDTLRASAAGVRLAFLDACASGEVTRLKGAIAAPPLTVNTPPDATGYVVITSSRYDEASQESDDLRGSFFTHALVSGLRGAGDRNGDGTVTLNEAYEHAYHRTVSRTAETRGGTQHPTYSFDLRGDGAVVLTRMTGLGVLAFGPAGPGSYLVYDPNLDVVVAEVEQSAGGEPQRVSLRPGVYLVKKRADDGVLLESVVIPANGGPVALDPARFTVVAFEDDVTKGPQAMATARARSRDLRAQARWFSVGAGIGYQTFFVQPGEGRLFPSTALGTLRLELPNLLRPGLGLHADVALGRTTHRFTAGGYDHEADFRFGLGGLGLDFDWPMGPFVFQWGPRLSAVGASRAFREPEAPPAQDLFTFCPGAEAALRLPIERLDLRAGLGGRMHYLRYTTATEDASLGFGEAYLTLEYAP